MSAITYATSGNSGIPKAFTLTAATMLARAERRPKCHAAEYSEVSSVLCLLREDCTAYYAHKIFQESRGCRWFGRDTLSDRICDEGVEAVIGEPEALERLVARLVGKHTFRYVLCTGHALTPELAKHLQTTIVSRNGFGESSYGASEVGRISRASFSQCRLLRGCAGELCEGTEVEIVAGEVHVKTPTMIAGYDDPALTRHHFKNGWFRPGDHGRFMANGLLVLDGRL